MAEQPAKADAKATTRAPRKRFSTAGTAPTADETAPSPGPAKTSRRPEAKTPVRPDVKIKKKEDDRVSFTWRLSPDKTAQHDRMMIRIRQDLGVPRLDKATVLDTLVTLVEENPSVYKALITRLRASV